MPPFADGLKKIRQNLLDVQEGRVPKLAKIGVLTPEQLQAANAKRAQLELEPIEAVIVFRGKHLYQMRS